MEFINREKEISFLNCHFASEPNSILFVYGPKSSGKSTLLEKVAKGLDKKAYAINFLDLRQVVIYDFKTFLDVFFQEDIKDKGKDILSGLTIKAGFFNVSFNDKALLKKNAFGLMVEKLQSANDRGVKPIIIIDEIQLLKNIALNGERYLIDELFNLFIAITKVKHLAHVVLATSDSYFIEEIYNSAKLSKTSRFFLLDHFERQDVAAWLQLENFTDEEIEAVWRHVGGCPWEMVELINLKRQGGSVQKASLDFIEQYYQKISEYRLNMEDKELKSQFDQIIKVIVKDGGYIRNDHENTVLVKKLLKHCIELDMWFYRPEQHKIIANSKSIFWAFDRIVKDWV